MMRLQIASRRGRWFWRLYDRHNQLIAQGATGYQTYDLARDHARFTCQGLHNCLRDRSLAPLGDRWHCQTSRAALTATRHAC